MVGKNNYGQLGVGDAVSRSRPTLVKALQGLSVCVLSLFLSDLSRALSF